jgi:hypothetical protein
MRVSILSMARCIFHIDLDAFFVSVEQVLKPKLKGKLSPVFPGHRELLLALLHAISEPPPHM